MTFAWPHFLWLLLVPAALVAWDLTRRRASHAVAMHPKILRAEIGQHELAPVRPSAQAAGRRMRPWLALGLAFAVIALARPQWGRIDEPVFDQSREILIAVDLSRSMLAQDVKPSRLERSKLLIQALLEKLKGERVGLVVFSGTAFLQSPLSADYEILREFLPALGPDFLPEGGTNYRALIDTSLDAFGAGSAADRFLIILSDGEATDDDWKPKVDELKKKGIRVIGLGVGTIAGTMIPDGSGGFVKDDRGAVVLSKLESSTLQQLAEATGGVYRDASTWIDLASLIDQTVNTAKKGAFEERNTVRFVERFQWPLAFALWCFLVSLYFEFPVRPRTRTIALRPGAPPPEPPKSQVTKATVALLAGMLVPVALSPIRARAAVKIEPPKSAPSLPPAPQPPADSNQSATAAITSPSMLGRIVGRLSQKDQLTAPDLSELAHETVNWGRALKDAGQPVPEGPVHDALSAVDQLEATGGNLADYSQLRKELEALLEKPEQKNPPPPKKSPKQDQKNQQNQPQQKDQSGSPQNQDKQQEQQKQNQPDQQNKSGEKSGDEKNQSEQKSSADQQKSNESAFGDMTKKPQPPPKPAEETQKVGGEQEKRPQEPTDPALALPLDKLDQLRDHDSPAELFQLMQSDRSEATRHKPAKDW